MDLDPDAPRPYVAAHLEDALARDPRVSEQGLRVALEGEPAAVVVRGTVLAAAHKAALVRVVHELLPALAVRDETTVADYPEPDEGEELP